MRHCVNRAAKSRDGTNLMKIRWRKDAGFMPDLFNFQPEKKWRLAVSFDMALVGADFTPTNLEHYFRN